MRHGKTNWKVCELEQRLLTWTVIQEQIVVEFESQGRDASAAKVKMSTWKMAEQKLIIQMNSILDRLDETGRRRPGCRRSRPSLRSLGRAPLNR